MDAYGPGDTLTACGLSGFFLFLIFAGGGESSDLSVEMIAAGSTIYLILVGAVWASLSFRQKNPQVLYGLGFRGLRPNAIFAALSLGAAFPVVQLANWFSSQVWFADQSSQPIVQTLANDPSISMRLAIILTAVVVAPFAEEFLFRGFLYGVIRKAGGRICAILTTSVLFAAIHLSLPAIPGLIVLAVALALAYELTGTLWVPIFMHAIFNGLSVAVILLAPEAIR